ncbi:MAG TPA: Nramp family divalent metal transporter [Longimicrobiaceae bacterium]
MAFAAVGPGLFLIGYNIGTGSIVTMAKAGAEHGMTLFWAVALSCVFAYVLMVAYGQVTIVTGRTALANFRIHFRRYHLGDMLAVYVICALVIGEILALMGIMGIVSELIQEGSRLVMGGTGWSTAVITVTIVLALFGLLWYGRYQAFEKVLTVFVVLMALSFSVVFVMVKPDLGVVVRGLLPTVPTRPGSLGLIAAMAGTTVSAALFIVRSIVVAEKGWTIDDLRREKKDAAVSAGMMLFLSGIIMAVSAGTLFVLGLRLDSTVDLIRLFEPLGGRAAAFILILGISAAGISTVFPIVLIAPWLIADFSGRPRDLRSPLFRILGGIGLLFSFGMLFMERRPPAMMIFSQAFQAMILPAVVLPIVILINRNELMRGHQASLRMNVGLAAAFLFGLMTAYFAVVELF